MTVQEIKELVEELKKEYREDIQATRTKLISDIYKSKIMAMSDLLKKIEEYEEPKEIEKIDYINNWTDTFHHILGTKINELVVAYNKLKEK